MFRDDIKMKTRVRNISISVLIALSGIFWILNFNRINIDGISGELSSLILGEDTRYSKEFSDFKFDLIRSGMTKDEVICLLGEPLNYFKPYDFPGADPGKMHYLALQYSDSPSSTHYRLRQIVINGNVVIDKIGYFYVD